MVVQKLNAQLEPIYYSSIPTQSVAWKISWEQCTIVTSGERGSARSVLAARHDNDDKELFISVRLVGWLFCFTAYQPLSGYFTPNQISYNSI